MGMQHIQCLAVHKDSHVDTGNAQCCPSLTYRIPGYRISIWQLQVRSGRVYLQHAVSLPTDTSLTRCSFLGGGSSP
jgi:hypothetical protein